MEIRILRKEIEELDKANIDFEAHLANRSRRNFLLDELSKTKKIQKMKESEEKYQESLKEAQVAKEELQAIRKETQVFEEEARVAKEHLIITVNNLLQMSMGDEKIAQVTGLSLHKIEQIKEQLSV